MLEIHLSIWADSALVHEKRLTARVASSSKLTCHERALPEDPLEDGFVTRVRVCKFGNAASGLVIIGWVALLSF
jgi:hypothetical protein